MKTIKDRVEDFIAENWRWIYALEIKNLRAGKESTERMKEVIEERKQLMAYLKEHKAKFISQE